MGELKQKTVKGLAWNTFNTLSNRLLTFVLGVVLARMLTPADYGLLAMVGVFTSVLNVFTDGGLTMALVRKENRTEEDMATVFWYNLVACWLLYATLFIAAPYIAEFYDRPILKDITRVTTVGLLYGPIGGIQSMLMRTRIDFKTPAIISLVSNVFSGIIAIIMAYNGVGVWSLVAQGIVGGVISTTAQVCMVRWYPKMGFSKKSFKELFSFSSKFLASQVLNTVYNNITPLVVGKYYSPNQLGEYERARGWAAMPSHTVHGVINSVTFPVLSKMQDDIERLSKNYRKMIRLIAFIVFPMMVGLAAVARPLTLFVLTEKWEGSIILLQIICFSMMWWPIHAINLNVLLVTGRSDYFLKLEVIKKVWGLSVMACTLPFGLIYFVSAGIVSSMVSLAVNTYYTGKIINVGYWKQMGDLMPILLNCCAMGGLCLFAQMPFSANGAKLAMAIPVGVIYYIASNWLMHSEEMKEVVQLIKKRGK